MYCPWDEVEEFDEYMAGLGRLRADDDLGEIESGAIDDAFRLLLHSTPKARTISPAAIAPRITPSPIGRRNLQNRSA